MNYKYTMILTHATFLLDTSNDIELVQQLLPPLPSVLASEPSHQKKQVGRPSPTCIMSKLSDFEVCQVVHTSKTSNKDF